MELVFNYVLLRMVFSLTVIVLQVNCTVKVRIF